MKQGLIGRAVLLGGSALAAVLCVGLYVGARATAAPPVPTAESSAPTAPAVGYVVGQWEGLLATGSRSRYMISILPLFRARNRCA